MFDVFALLNEILRCLHLIGCTVMPLRTCIRMERKCVCVCVFSYRNHILTPVLFCSDTRVRQSTGQERSFKLWEHELSIRQLSLSAQPGVNRHDTSKCLVYGETVLVPLFPLLQSAFFIGMVKTSFQRKLVCTHIQQCFLSPSYIGEKSAQIFASRAAILARLL